MKVEITFDKDPYGPFGIETVKEVLLQRAGYQVLGTSRINAPAVFKRLADVLQPKES